MSIGVAVNEFLFGIYPYIALAVLLLGSVVRFDREPYTWKSDSSQLLRRHQMRLGSNLFHYGILVVIIGHFVGFLTPEWAIDWAISPTQHALMAMLVGGIAGLVAIVGMSILIHRRVTDPRVRNNSRKWDLAVVLLLWLQLALGLLTVPFSAAHMSGAMFEVLVTYVQGIVTFHGGVASLLLGTPIIYRIHIFVGFTIFLISPFTRMIHIWSGVGSLAYLFRPYQLVRTRRRTS